MERLDTVKKAPGGVIAVVEPGRRSIETAHQIRKMAGDIGVKKLSFVGNKIRTDKDRIFLEKQMPDFHFLGFLPYKAEIIEADLDGRPPFEKDKETLDAVKGMLAQIKIEAE